MIFGLIMGTLFACGEEKGTEEAEVQSCGVEASSSSPSSGSANIYVKSSVSFELSAEDATATISLADSAGTAVSGSSSVDGTTVTFTPDADLTPSTEYTASLTYCGSADPATATFTTSDLGTPLENSIAGNTYAVDVASGTFVQPAGVGSLIGDAINVNILLGIVDDANDELVVRGAISEEGSMAQDTCTETLEDFPAADFSSSPYFEIPEGDLTLSVAGYTATIYSLNVSGMFSADGSYFGGGELRGKLDARDLVDIANELGLGAESADDICALVVGFGVPCEPCSDGNPYCVGVEVIDLEAEETGTELVAVTQEDIDAAIAEGTCEAPEEEEQAE